LAAWEAVATGMANCEGEKEAKCRRIINPAFHVEEYSWTSSIKCSNLFNLARTVIVIL